MRSGFQLTDRMIDDALLHARALDDADHRRRTESGNPGGLQRSIEGALKNSKAMLADGLWCLTLLEALSEEEFAELKARAAATEEATTQDNEVGEHGSKK